MPDYTIPHRNEGWTYCPLHETRTGWWHWCGDCGGFWGANPWGWNALAMVRIHKRQDEEEGRT